MKHWPFLLTAAASLAVVPVMAGHAQEQNALKALMLKKLESSQKVLEGLALSDFERIGKHAEELVRISKTADFRVLKTPQYEIYSNDFRRGADALVMMAEGKNLDGAALAYVELTLTCVKCHKHVRETRMARAD